MKDTETVRDISVISRREINNLSLKKNDIRVIVCHWIFGLHIEHVATKELSVGFRFIRFSG